MTTVTLAPELATFFHGSQNQQLKWTGEIRCAGICKQGSIFPSARHVPVSSLISGDEIKRRRILGVVSAAGRNENSFVLPNEFWLRRDSHCPGRPAKGTGHCFRNPSFHGREKKCHQRFQSARDESASSLNVEKGIILQTGIIDSSAGEEENQGPGEEENVPETENGWWQKRWTIVGLCFVAFLLCNMDRVNMSIAILPMSEEFAWSPLTVGLVQSSFFWGYLLTQIVGGIWADTVGGKQVLGFGVVWWSLATILTPFAAKLGLPVLLFARACMGIGEGVAMPAMNNMLSKWVPVEERSRSLALVYSGMYLGSVLGLSVSPSLIHAFGWPSVFFSFGSLGTFWIAAWASQAYSSPADDPTLSNDERSLIANSKLRHASKEIEGTGGEKEVLELTHGGGGHFVEEPLRLENVPWRLLLSKAPVWAIIVSHFCHNWGVFILLTWMPTYYHDVLGFNLSESGFFSVLPWLTMAISSNFGGWIADSLISRGWSVTLVRKVMQTIGFMGPAICLSLLSSIKSPFEAVLLLMLSQGADAFSQSGLYSNHQDIGPRYAGILLGLSNTAGVLAGVLGTYITGQILQTGSWDSVFEVAVGLYVVGTIVWNVFSTGERVFD